MNSARIMICVAFAFAAGSGRAAEVDGNIPADSEIVVSINVEQLLASPLGKKFLRTAVVDAIKGNPEGQDALKYLELDPTRDISRITVALASASADSGFIIVRGKFNRAKIADLAEKVAADQKDKLKVHKSAGGAIYELTGDKTTFTTFPNDTTLLLSTDRDQLGKTGKPKKELAALIEKIDGTQSAWLAVLASAASAMPTNDDAQKQALEKLESITGVLKVQDNARLELALLSRDSASATATNKLIGDLYNLVKLFGPQAVKDRPELAPLLEVISTVRTSAKGKVVTVTADASGELIEKAVKKFGGAK